MDRWQRKNLDFSSAFSPDEYDASDLSLSDLYKLDGSSPEQVEQPSAGSGTGLGASDYVGYGLQAAGGLMAEQAQAKQLEQERKDKAIADRNSQLNFMKQLALNAQSQQDATRQRDREQNMGGLNMLMGMTERARTMGRRMSFSDHLAKVAGY